MADKGLLDLEDDTEFAATGDDPLELVGRVFVVIGKNQEVVKDDDGPVWEVFEVENVLDY